MLSAKLHNKETSDRPKTVKKRLAYLDIVRFLAAVHMVFGHTIDSLLIPSLRQTSGFGAWTVVRGFTSVTFLFSSGYAYFITTLGRQLEPAKAAAVSKKRIRRALSLLGIGYMMRFPGDSLAVGAFHLAWKRMWIVDVLQCIGMSLLALEGMRRFGKGQKRTVVLVAIYTVLVWSLFPWAERLRVSDAWLPLANYITLAHGSLFPMLPWSGYMTAGALCAAIVHAPFRISENKVPIRLMLLGAMGHGAATILGHVGVDNVLAVAIVLGRASIVTALMGVIAWLLARLNIQVLPAWIETVASETLVIYVFHVVLVYGSFGSLRTFIGPSLGFFSCLLVASLVFALSFWVVRAFEWRRAFAKGPSPG